MNKIDYISCLMPHISNGGRLEIDSDRYEFCLPNGCVLVVSELYGMNKCVWIPNDSLFEEVEAAAQSIGYTLLLEGYGYGGLVFRTVNTGVVIQPRSSLCHGKLAVCLRSILPFLRGVVTVAFGLNEMCVDIGVRSDYFVIGCHDGELHINNFFLSSKETLPMLEILANELGFVAKVVELEHSCGCKIVFMRNGNYGRPV